MKGKVFISFLILLSSCALENNDFKGGVSFAILKSDSVRTMSSSDSFNLKILGEKDYKSLKKEIDSMEQLIKTDDKIGPVIKD